MSETKRVGGIRSALIGYGVLAFTFFPPTRTLMLGGIGMQIVALFSIATLGGIMRFGEQI